MKLKEIDENFQSSSIEMAQFWIAVWTLTNNQEKKLFPDLTAFALRVLSLPVSNAVVERVFSVMGTVKNKLRNRMGLQMLVAILRIRIHLFTLEICCSKFEPSHKMIQMCNSAIYDPKKNSDSLEVQDDDDIALEDAIDIFTSDDFQFNM